MEEKWKSLLNPSTLAALVALSERAGEAILEVYHHEDFGTRLKADHSPVTDADLAAHRCIVDGLARLTPALPVLSEESRHTSWAERKQWQTYWLVDPLDGTREFIKRNDEFTVNIALIHEHTPVLGVVHAPVMGVTWWGCEGQGAHKRTADGGGPIAVSGRAIPRGGEPVGEHPLRMALSRSHIREADGVYLEKLRAMYADPTLTRVGSSMKFCLIAEGLADIYPRMGPTSEWDTAAAHCVLAQAGGVLTQPDGRPLVYNKEDLENPFFVARAPQVELPPVTD